MNQNPEPPDLVVAIVTIETWPPLEIPYPYPRKQSTPPKPQPWLSYELHLVNRGDAAVDARHRTGGYASDDEGLTTTSETVGAHRVEAHNSVLLETTDDGAFDFTFWYEVDATRVGTLEVWRGLFGVSRFGGGPPFDRYEDDPVLGRRVRAIRADDWAVVTG